MPAGDTQLKLANNHHVASLTCVQVDSVQIIQTHCPTASHQLSVQRAAKKRAYIVLTVSLFVRHVHVQKDHRLYICNQCCCFDDTVDSAGMGTQKCPTREAHLWRWCSSQCWASCTRSCTQSSRTPQNSAHTSHPWPQLTQISLLQLCLQSLNLSTRQATSLVLLSWALCPILLCIWQLMERDLQCQLAAPVPKSLSLLRLSN